MLGETAKRGARGGRYLGSCLFQCRVHVFVCACIESYDSCMVPHSFFIEAGTDGSKVFSITTNTQFESDGVLSLSGAVLPGSEFKPLPQQHIGSTNSLASEPELAKALFNKSPPSPRASSSSSSDNRIAVVPGATAVAEYQDNTSSRTKLPLDDKGSLHPSAQESVDAMQNNATVDMKEEDDGDSSGSSSDDSSDDSSSDEDDDNKDEKEKQEKQEKQEKERVAVVKAQPRSTKPEAVTPTRLLVSIFCLSHSVVSAPSWCLFLVILTVDSAPSW